MPESEVIKNTQHIYDLIEMCSLKNTQHAVVCPGSRCAPLLIACDQHARIKTISVTDERSASFMALGIAQQTHLPVILVCTSGTAGQNFAPAITEAFYQQVPLIVLTADRPAEWIDQWDGQTIHQQDMYANHIKASMVFVKGETSLQQADQLLNQCITDATGPVHINIPISKPFYPLSPNDKACFRTLVTTPPVNRATALDEIPWNRLQDQLNQSSKVLVHYGQHIKNLKLESILSQAGLPIIGDIISNINSPERTDIFFNTNNNKLRPDLLITLGRSVISEKHKQYFRQHKPKYHWHIGIGMIGDPFQTLTDVIPVNPLGFFREWIIANKLTHQVQHRYQAILKKRRKEAQLHIATCLSEHPFNQYAATATILKHLPENSTLHLANSMTVRAANQMGLISDNGIEIWSNRGTSGIDGCLSTAVGHAIANPEQTHVLIIGDLAFFYDHNGLWLNQELPHQLIIVLMNNGGGGIFNLIPGPSSQGSGYHLFNTPHHRTAKPTADDFNLYYQSIYSLEELEGILDSTLNHLSGTAILEVFTDMKTNEQAFLALTAPQLRTPS